MRKLLTLDERFPTGEPTVIPVLLWGPRGTACRERVKTASEASDYIQAVTPVPGKSIVLVLALGTHEFYGLNRNADGFNERPYKVGQQPRCGCCKAEPGGWVADGELVQQHFLSFERDGKNYVHHQNKDPLKAVGDVRKAFFNAFMHRVELLVELDNAKAPDLAERIASGQYPPVSMGCRIKYDVCTICGHRSPTRAQYCDHLKFHMRQLFDGVPAGALNPSPRWFDISWVIKPADQTGYMLKKVAHDEPITISSAALGEYWDRVDEKRAAVRKVADIDKKVRGVPVDHKSSPLPEPEARAVELYRDTTLPLVTSRMPEIDDDTLRSLAREGLPQVLSTLQAAGVVLTTPEMVKLVVEQLAPGTRLPEQVLDAIVGMQGHLFELLAEHPQILDQLTSTGALDVDRRHVRPEIGAKLGALLEKRSTISDYLVRRFVPPEARPEEPPWTDTLHVDDPTTGQRYTTTRGAAASAHDEIAKRQLYKMIGGAALLAGAYKVLSPGIPAALRPLALGTAGLVGYKALKPDYGPQYVTEEGVGIPTLTELQKSSSELAQVALPVLGSAALVTALGHDYDSRLRRGYPVGDPGQPLHRRALDAAGGFASENPVLSFLTGLLGYHTARGLLTKHASIMHELELADAGGDELPEIDMDRLAESLGAMYSG